MPYRGTSHLFTPHSCFQLPFIPTAEEKWHSTWEHTIKLERKDWHHPNNPWEVPGPGLIHPFSHKSVCFLLKTSYTTSTLESCATFSHQDRPCTWCGFPASRRSCIHTEIYHQSSSVAWGRAGQICSACCTFQSMETQHMGYRFQCLK